MPVLKIAGTRYFKERAFGGNTPIQHDRYGAVFLSVTKNLF